MMGKSNKKKEKKVKVKKTEMPIIIMKPMTSSEAAREGLRT